MHFVLNLMIMIFSGVIALTKSFSLRVPSSISATAVSINHPSTVSTIRNIQTAKLSTITEFKPILISIEGNIGAGKTTLLKKLREDHPDWIFIDEPVDTWSKIQNDAGESILEVFYKDRRRWSYTFQNCALLTRFQNIESSVLNAKLESPFGSKVFLTERCLDTDYYVFTKMLQDEGSIDALEMHLYERLLKQLKLTATSLSAIIHVDTEPLVCKERIKMRGRSGEEAITLDYLKLLDYHQRKWVDSTHLPILKTDLTDYKKIEGFIQERLDDSYQL